MAPGKECFLHFHPAISLATLMLNNNHPPQRESLLVVRLGPLSVLWKYKLHSSIFICARCRMNIQYMYVLCPYPLIDFLREYLTLWMSTNLNHGKGYLTSSDTTEGWNSSVGVANRYRPDGSGCESRWGRYYSHTSRPALGPTQPPVQWVWGFSHG